MDWTDQGIVLSARKHGETSAIVSLMTREHGVHAGLVRGGVGKRSRGILQPGNTVQAHWRARLPEHLGAYTCELVHAQAAVLMDHPLRLAGLSAACALVETTLPERESHARVYESLLFLLAAMAGDHWPADYVLWEVEMLRELGFGLDLGCCAATGETENLAYVSPKTGRAVSAAAGEPYKSKLLPLPGFLLAEVEPVEDGQVLDGLKLTGYFLERHVYAPHGRKIPPARRRLVERLSRAAG